METKDAIKPNTETTTETIEEKVEVPKKSKSLNETQRRIHDIIFEADTFGGKVFDIALLVCISLSVLITALDSVEALHSQYQQLFVGLEIAFTALFSIEYALRLYCVAKPMNYALSFYGIIDLVAILPNYISLLFPGAHFLSIIRIIRFFRIFRILKLAHFLREATVLADSLKKSIKRIAVFTLFIFIAVICIGSIMYVIEGGKNGFTSIPVSVYWAVVTMTTVGYGDISPQTPLGQFFSFWVMLLGYGVIAIPTGIVTSEIISSNKKKVTTQVCPFCCKEGHDHDAIYCKYCGKPLND